MTPNTPSWIQSSPIAHRGLHNIAAGIPENSLASFTAAIEGGYPIELDVRLSRDGAPIVFHDATLERMCGRPERVSDLTADELGRINLLRTSETIPTLQDVFAHVASRTPILIEIKNYSDDPVGPLEAAVRNALGGYRGETAVQSFSPQTIAWFRNNLPSQPRGQLASPDVTNKLAIFYKYRLSMMLLLQYGAPQFVGYHVKYLPAPLTERARAAGLPVLAWTVRSAADRERARSFADNIIFENE